MSIYDRETMTRAARTIEAPHRLEMSPYTDRLRAVIDTLAGALRVTDETYSDEWIPGAVALYRAAAAYHEMAVRCGADDAFAVGMYTTTAEIRGRLLDAHRYLSEGVYVNSRPMAVVSICMSAAESIARWSGHFLRDAVETDLARVEHPRLARAAAQYTLQRNLEKQRRLDAEDARINSAIVAYQVQLRERKDQS